MLSKWKLDKPINQLFFATRFLFLRISRILLIDSCAWMCVWLCVCVGLSLSLCVCVIVLCVTGRLTKQENCKNFPTVKFPVFSSKIFHPIFRFWRSFVCVWSERTHYMSSGCFQWELCHRRHRQVGGDLLFSIPCLLCKSQIIAQAYSASLGLFTPLLFPPLFYLFIFLFGYCRF